MCSGRGHFRGFVRTRTHTWTTVPPGRAQSKGCLAAGGHPFLLQVRKEGRAGQDFEELTEETAMWPEAHMRGAWSRPAWMPTRCGPRACRGRVPSRSAGKGLTGPGGYLSPSRSPRTHPPPHRGAQGPLPVPHLTLLRVLGSSRVTARPWWGGSLSSGRCAGLWNCGSGFSTRLNMCFGPEFKTICLLAEPKGAAWGPPKLWQRGLSGTAGIELPVRGVPLSGTPTLRDGPDLPLAQRASLSLGRGPGASVTSVSPLGSRLPSAWAT